MPFSASSMPLSTRLVPVMVVVTMPYPMVRLRLSANSAILRPLLRRLRRSMHSRCAPSHLTSRNHDMTCRQIAASNLRFGDGVTAEVGMDLKNMKARKVGRRLRLSILAWFITLGWCLYRPQCRKAYANESSMSGYLIHVRILKTSA